MSREEQVTQLTDYMAKFIAHVAKKLPDDGIAKLQELREKEDSPLSKVIYDTMFRNQELAVALNRPSCQDTGSITERSSSKGYIRSTASSQQR